MDHRLFLILDLAESRAGTATAYYFVDTITEELANYGANVGESTAVGKYTPNTFGLYDMSGNVWQWCQDNWHFDHSESPILPY